MSRKLLAAILLASLACNGDPAEPILIGDLQTITIDLCNASGFGWFAYQNNGGPWTQVQPTIEGKLEFEATPKVSIAMAAGLFGSSTTFVFNTTRGELSAGGSAICDAGLSGPMTLSGTVTGLTGTQVARIAAGPSSEASADASANAWTLEELPSSAIDVIATRYPSSSAQPADRVIVRRSIVPNDQTLSPFDFGGAESLLPETNAADFTNVPGGGTLSVVSTVQTANGTRHELSNLSSTAATSISYLALPIAARTTTDLHQLEATYTTATGGLTIFNYFRAPGAKSFAFGPQLNTPTVTTITNGQPRRIRAQLPFQAEYPTAAEANFVQASSLAVNVVLVITTGSFAGTTGEWDLNIPDMGSAGYPLGFGLKSGDYTWSVSAYKGDFTSILGEPPSDGATVFAATRSSANAVTTSLSPKRFRHFR